jgi:hypothetical protein
MLALNFDLFDPCNFNHFRERNSPALNKGGNRFLFPSPLQGYGVHTSIGRKGFNRLIPHKSPNFGQLEILFLPLILELGQRN